MTEAERIKVLVSYESPLLQAGLMATLAGCAALDCTEGGGSAMWGGGAAAPDVIVTDHGRGIDWVGAIAGLAMLRSRPQVLVVSQSDRECDIRAALSGGVQGYLLVDEAPEMLAAATRAVARGGRFLSPTAASRLAENVAVEALTQREAAALGLVVEGLCNKAIASRLGITAGTVKSHLRAVFAKLGATSRTQAVAIAHRRGLFRFEAATRHDDGIAASAARRPLPDPHAWRPAPALASIGG